MLISMKTYEQRSAEIKEYSSPSLKRDRGEVFILVSDLKWLIERADENKQAIYPIPIEEWHEDDGDCLWWKFPIEEPPYCGSPLDKYWPEYHTHFTRLLMPLDILE
ncbi:hypothetical protein [Sporosarcina cyprini]|uniref:hypothetical protein n=1 Tax=Sporosarcina cyprini TaxID=2910523 RepID=UPI001EDD4554|nr:hypothetical protein [Sporosarcina cyprini]MCG3089152.1 hypothetical protein [Sporosarcina cyprini]